MRLRYILGTLLVLSVFIQPASGQAYGYTEDGKRIILHADGTWKLAPVEKDAEEVEGGTFVKPTDATKVLTGSKAGYELWYNPKVWTVFEQEGSNDTEFSFKLNRGEAFAMVVPQRISVPIGDLKISVIEKARSASPDWRVVKNESRIINGKALSMMQMEGPFKGIGYVYFGYYYSGPEGTIQFFAYTQRNNFEDFQADIEALLNGLIIRL